VVALCALAFGSLTWAGCALDEGIGDETAELQAAEELVVDESGAEGVRAEELEVSDLGAPDEVQTSIAGRYCVDQSYASIQYVDLASCGTLPCFCPNELTPHNQFSRNHPVNAHYECGPYFFVKDLWSENYGWMRRDGLRPC
jgi:hypothetical protein